MDADRRLLEARRRNQRPPDAEAQIGRHLFARPLDQPAQDPDPGRGRRMGEVARLPVPALWARTRFTTSKRRAMRSSMPSSIRSISRRMSARLFCGLGRLVHAGAIHKEPAPQKQRVSGPGEIAGALRPRMDAWGRSCSHDILRRAVPMTSDLIVRNATLPDGRTGQSILCRDGRIADVGTVPEIAGAREIDARGYLVSPPFVDAHFHMDATLSLGQPRLNRSGTLLEGIALWGELKPQLTHEALVERALAYCDWAVARGLLAIRSHVDTSDPSLLPVEAMLDVQKRVAPYIDLQLVAFPQDGVLRTKGGLDNLKRALAMGVDVVGGIPHFERTMADGAESVCPRTSRYWTRPYQ